MLGKYQISYKDTVTKQKYDSIRREFFKEIIKKSLTPNSKYDYVYSVLSRLDLKSVFEMDHYVPNSKENIYISLLKHIDKLFYYAHKSKNP